MASLTTLHAASPLNADDGVYLDFTADTDGQVLSRALDNTDADFGTMDTGLTWTVVERENATGGDDSYTLRIRIVNGATILAAADAGGTYATVIAHLGSGHHTADATRGPTAFAYVNTTADKATWDGATVELQQSYVKSKGNDGNFFKVDDVAFNGTYTVASEDKSGSASTTAVTGSTASGTKGSAGTPDSYVSLPAGDASRVQTTDKAAFAPGTLDGDTLEFRVDYERPATQTGESAVIGQWADAGNQRGWQLNAKTVSSNNVFDLYMTPDGSTWSNISATSTIPENTRFQVRVVHTAHATAASNTVIVYVRTDTTKDLDDNTGWTEIYNQSRATDSAIKQTLFNSTEELIIGRFNDGTARQQNGRAYQASLAINGSAVANPDWRRSAVTTDDYANTWDLVVNAVHVQETGPTISATSATTATGTPSAEEHSGSATTTAATGSTASGQKNGLGSAATAKYLTIPDTQTDGDYVVAADGQYIEITDDLEVVMRVRSEWDTQQAFNRWFVSKRASSSNFARSWQVSMNNGAVQFLKTGVTDSESFDYDFTSSDGMASLLVDGDEVWFKFTVDVQDGSNNFVARFYYSLDDTQDPTAVSWTELGTAQTQARQGTVNNIDDTTSPTEIGTYQEGLANGAGFDLLYLDAKAGIDGTKRIEADFSDPGMDNGNGTFTDAQGVVWTINGAADWPTDGIAAASSATATGITAADERSGSASTTAATNSTAAGTKEGAGTAPDQSAVSATASTGQRDTGGTATSSAASDSTGAGAKGGEGTGSATSSSSASATGDKAAAGTAPDISAVSATSATGSATEAHEGTASTSAATAATATGEPQRAGTAPDQSAATDTTSTGDKAGQGEASTSATGATTGSGLSARSGTAPDISATTATSATGSTTEAHSGSAATSATTDTTATGVRASEGAATVSATTSGTGEGEKQANGTAVNSATSGVTLEGSKAASGTATTSAATNSTAAGTAATVEEHSGSATTTASTAATALGEAAKNGTAANSALPVTTNSGQKDTSGTAATSAATDSTATGGASESHSGSATTGATTGVSASGTKNIDATPSVSATSSTGSPTGTKMATSSPAIIAITTATALGITAREGTAAIIGVTGSTAAGTTPAFERSGTASTTGTTTTFAFGFNPDNLRGETAIEYAYRTMAAKTTTAEARARVMYLVQKKARRRKLRRAPRPNGS